jgi:putative ABC transport system permease protein
MFRQYFKQAIQMLKENRLTSVISILGTALSIAMILVVILQFQIKLVGVEPGQDALYHGDTGRFTG